MQARDVMTTSVVTVGPDAGVGEIAKLLLGHRISGVPVVDAEARLLGIVTEGDLMRRPEIETERQRSWWLRILADPRDIAKEYAQSHGTRARDVMTAQVITVAEDAPLGEIARLLEERRIKRVPVVRDGKLVGIVSRANLLQGLAARSDAVRTVAPIDDRSLRERVAAVLARQGWTSHGTFNVIVTDGVVELWGLVESDEERKAVRIAAEGVPGVRAVKDHLGAVRPWVLGT